MGRVRKEIDKWMPKRVYIGKAAFELHPKSGGCIRLCSLESPRSTVWRRYEQEMKRLEIKGGSFSELVDLYMSSPQFSDLAPRSRKDAERYWLKIEPVFGRAKADIIEPKHIRAYMDKRGNSSKTQANREKSFMSAAFSWGFERGKVTKNPCQGVKAFTEKARDRYVTDEEYNAVYAVAPDYVKACMEISYLCAARKGDVLKLSKGQLSDEGIFIRQGKTGKAQIKMWTPRLREAVTLAKNVKSRIETMYVIHSKHGQKYTISGFDSAWDKAKKTAAMTAKKNSLVMSFDFTFHDLKAKGVSDYEGDKQRFSGHKTPSQVAVYDRKTQVVETIKLPRK